MHLIRSYFIYIYIKISLARKVNLDECHESVYFVECIKYSNFTNVEKPTADKDTSSVMILLMNG